MPVPGGRQARSWSPMALWRPRCAADEVITTEVTVDRRSSLPIKAGDVYGHVVVKAGGKEVGRVNLVATKSFRRVTLGSKLAYFWHRLSSAKLGIRIASGAST